MRLRLFQLAFLISAYIFITAPQLRADECDEYCDACYDALEWCGGNWNCSCRPADGSGENHCWCGGPV